MKTPMQELIEECKSHLRDSTTHRQQYKTDIRKLITALERASSLINTKEKSISISLECIKFKPEQPYHSDTISSIKGNLWELNELRPENQIITIVLGESF